jgi:PPE-repeat protein
MTAPIWIAEPPEVHSALLSSGPGPGSLLAAAGAWDTLSAEYASVAEELTAVLADVQAGAWAGPSAESYVAAHVPYLAWLMQASANSAAAAAQHETAAAAHTAALAAMPTLAELATNHIVHGVLVATNFFGLNTIPIALNEADYVRMWIQAATTMSIYEAISSAAVASAPQTTPAPVVVNPVSTWVSSLASAINTVEQLGQDASTLNLFDLESSLVNLIQNFSIAAFMQDPVGYTQQVVESFVGQFPLLSDLYFGFGGDHVFEFLANPVGYVENIINKFLADPLLYLSNPFLLVLSPDDFASIGYSVISPFVAPSALAVAPVGAVGFAGLAQATGLTVLPEPVVAPVLAPVAHAPALLPVVGMAPTAVATAVAPGTAPAPAPTASTVANPAPPPTPPAAGGAGFAPPYAVAPPGIDVGRGLPTSASSSAKRKAPQPDSAAAVSAAAAREQARARRRRRAKQRGHYDEFMEMDVEVDPDWDGQPVASTAASDRAAGTLGFAGTVSKGGARPTGLTALSGDDFGGGPRMPMLPNTWNPEAPGGEREDD